MTPLFHMLQLIFNSNDLDGLISRVYAPQTFKRLVTLVTQTDQTLVSLTLLLRNNVQLRGDDPYKQIIVEFILLLFYFSY